MTVITAPVLGVPVRYVVEGEPLAALVRASFEPWQRLPADLLVARPPVEVRLTLSAAGEVEVPAIAYSVRAAGHFSFSAGASRGEVSAMKGRATAVISDVWLRDPVSLREAVLEALTYSLVTVSDRRPVHAAAVVRGPRLLLLAGSSGAGKSTLAYLAGQEGWSVRSDDHVFVSCEPELRIWTPVHRRFRLDPVTAASRPELAALPVRTMPNGKLRVVIDGGPAEVVPWSGPVHVVLLARGEDGTPARVEPVTEQEVIRGLTHRLEGGFDLDRVGAREAGHALSRDPGFRLWVARSPESTLAALAAAMPGD